MKKRTLPAKWIAGVAFPLLLAAPLAQAQSYTFSSVATLGGSTPFLSYFEPGSITNLDQVVFGPSLTTGGEGVFLWRRGQITAIAEGGQTMPDGGVLGFTLSPVTTNVLGDVVFTMTRDGVNNVPTPVGLDAGVYRYNTHTGVTPVMVPGLAGHGGDTFFGASFIAEINNRREIVFPGMICSTDNNSVPTVPCPDGGPGVLALGVYTADVQGAISPAVVPGDPVPGSVGQTFDFVRGPGLNDAGDIAFTAHVFGEACGNPSQLFCDESLYIKRASTGTIESIAHYGMPSPVPGKNYSSSFGPVLDRFGNVAFTSDLSVAGDGTDVAVFLYTGGKTIVIAKSGDAMPGGGTFATGGFYVHDTFINNFGDVAFDGTLTNGDNGLYLWHRGNVYLVAKTGTNTGFGTISTLDDFGGGVANTQIAMNDSGQIIFSAKFQEGGGALLTATPPQRQ